MRPIKFRQTLPHSELSFRPLHYWGIINGLFTNPYSNICSDQYTGIEDSSGIEIYERDKVAGKLIKRSAESIHSDYWYEEEVEGVVKFLEGAFYVGITNATSLRGVILLSDLRILSVLPMNIGS